MSKLDRSTIQTLKKLARIHCEKEEEEALLGDLRRILDYVEQLQEVDVDGLPPCNHVLENFTNVMRDDVPGETLPRETYLQNAPDQLGGMVRIPPLRKEETSS